MLAWKQYSNRTHRGKTKRNKGVRGWGSLSYRALSSPAPPIPLIQPHRPVVPRHTPSTDPESDSTCSLPPPLMHSLCLHSLPESPHVLPQLRPVVQHVPVTKGVVSQRRAVAPVGDAHAQVFTLAKFCTGRKCSFHKACLDSAVLQLRATRYTKTSGKHLFFHNRILKFHASMQIVLETFSRTVNLIVASW